MGWAGCCQAEWKWKGGIGALCVPRRPLGVKVHVWEPRVLGISTKRRVSASGPRRVECARASSVAGGQWVELDSEAIAAAGFGVNAVAFERLEHTTRAKVSPKLRRDKGGGWGKTFRTCGGLGGWCEADCILFDCAAALGCRRTVSGILETASPPLGLKVEDEEGFQDVLGHGPEVALGEDGEFVGGYHDLGSGIEVAGNIAPS